MPRIRPPYPEEYRRKIVELVLSSRSLYELAKEFEPTSVTINSWVKQAALVCRPNDRIQLAVKDGRLRFAERIKSINVLKCEEGTESG